MYTQSTYHHRRSMCELVFFYVAPLIVSSSWFIHWRCRISYVYLFSILLFVSIAIVNSKRLCFHIQFSFVFRTVFALSFSILHRYTIRTLRFQICYENKASSSNELVNDIESNVVNLKKFIIWRTVSHINIRIGPSVT